MRLVPTHVPSLRFLALAAVLGTVPDPGVAQQGVPETRNAKAALSAAPRLILSEELRIGEEEESGPLPSIRFLAVNDEGWIFLIDAASGGAFMTWPSTDALKVRIFDSGGRLRRAIGSRGTFNYPFGFAVARDSIVVMDWSPPRGGEAPIQRSQVLAVHGGALATHEYPRGSSLPPLNFSRNVVRGTSTGWVLEGTGGWIRGWILKGEDPPVPPRGQMSGPHHGSTLILSFLPAAGEFRRILSYPGASYYQNSEGFSRDPVLSSRPRHAVGGDGRIYTHAGADYVITVHGHEGAVERRIVGELNRIPVTDEDVEEGIRREIEKMRVRREEIGGGDEVDSIEIEKEMRWAGKADFRPVLGEMWASRDGSILVQRLDLAEDPWAAGESGEWDVIGPDGRIAGRLATPGGFRVRAFEWPHIYLTRRTGDRQEVVRFRIGPS